MTSIVLFKLFVIFLQYYLESSSDVNNIFPSGEVGGVSSAIVLSLNENFLIYSQINYDGLTGLLEAGKWYPTPEDMGFPNDTLQSIRKEWANQTAWETRPLYCLPFLNACFASC